MTQLHNLDKLVRIDCYDYFEESHRYQYQSEERKWSLWRKHAGVLNCEAYFESGEFQKENLFVKSEESTQLDWQLSLICKKRVKWLSNLCKETNAKVVISSS